MSKSKGAFGFLIFAILLNAVRADMRFLWLFCVFLGLLIGFGIKKWICCSDDEDGIERH